jgi:hypothetical protein
VRGRCPALLRRRRSYSSGLPEKRFDLQVLAADTGRLWRRCANAENFAHRTGGGVSRHVQAA